MGKLIGFLNSMEKLDGQELYTVLLKFATEPDYLHQILTKQFKPLVELCTFPEECIENFDIELSRRLHNLAVIIFYRLGLGLDSKGKFFAVESKLLHPEANYNFNANVIEVAMEIVCSLMRANLCIISLSYYNYLRNRVELCGRNYMKVFGNYSTAYFRHLLAAFLPAHANMPFEERYRNNDPHHLLPDLTTPLDQKFLATLKETKVGKVERTLCAHGLQRSIPKQDVTAKQLCYLTGYSDWHHKRCH